ncbi:MAG: hypothetical protein CMP12_21265 [Zunongwangia sp.]|uniref:Uncharacterized protein n=1 Tax=Zunongwangia profunda TaxID=398743 RepID=A0A3D5IV00_9FLAO|nr:hypothetical protein [Zunongwangia sp.]MAS70884.1 hypothetical protein [Zunongwangia sp.]HCV79695.1 hypothetical protein [Zunongwangia profunda]|tara:strand:- start:766 stop:1002 length:237 start_codon:yes stop_codon:yes gene_type:complete
MKGAFKLIGIILLLPIALGVIVLLLAFIVALSPAITICFVSYQIKEYLIYRKSCNSKLNEKKALKRTSIFDHLRNENT